MLAAGEGGQDAQRPRDVVATLPSCQAEGAVRADRDADGVVIAAAGGAERGGEAAAFAGVPLVRTKLLSYGIGAALGGVSGAFLASFLTSVNPNQFTFQFSILILAMVVLGGLGSIWGVVLGAVALSVFNTYLMPTVLRDVPGIVGLDFNFALLSSGIYGFLLVILMLLRPEGLVPERRRASG